MIVRSCSFVSTQVHSDSSTLVHHCYSILYYNILRTTLLILLMRRKDQVLGFLDAAALLQKEADQAGKRQGHFSIHPPAIKALAKSLPVLPAFNCIGVLGEGRATALRGWSWILSRCLCAGSHPSLTMTRTQIRIPFALRFENVTVTTALQEQALRVSLERLDVRSWSSWSSWSCRGTFFNDPIWSLSIYVQNVTQVPISFD